MADIVLVGDVEDVLVGYLSTELAAAGDAASAHVTVPNPRPDRFVVVPRVGGTMRSRVVDQPTIGIECWDQRSAAAYRLAALVRGLVHDLRGRVVDGMTFYRIQEFGGPANLPDPASLQARYVLTVSVRVRGERL